jgi:hypothetical protein
MKESSGLPLAGLSLTPLTVAQAQKFTLSPSNRGTLKTSAKLTTAKMQKHRMVVVVIEIVAAVLFMASVVLFDIWLSIRHFAKCDRSH